MIETTTINFGMVNAFLIKGENGFILIDTGIPPLISKLEKELRKAGCTKDDLKLVIITHGDMDHVGNAITLREKYNAKIAIHEADYPMVRDGKPLKRAATGFIWKLMSRAGEKPGDPNPAFEVDLFLTDGQRLDEFGLAARIIHTPGHTPGSISILTDDGQLFCGDIFANRRSPSLAPLIENSEQILASLQKIKQAQPKIIFPGHGKPFFGVALEDIKA
ncbi:MAG: MBL fold metallo-hydrolase [Anaerolineaceae bacterium]|nr:MBL fold metallo-hydrolase [Anaerolineaceae bacterium]